VYASAQRHRVASVHHLDCFEPISRGVFMNLNLSFTPIISLIAGILILIVPRLLNYIVAIYLIVVGLTGLLGGSTFHLR
jgi:hypothetical protein